jgi:hypothetical protein
VLTEKEEQVKDYMINKFVPTLHSIFKEKNPSEYKKWGGNACRQTAIYSAHALTELLPEYNWKVYDGIFKDKFQGRDVKYNHAWDYGVNKENNKKLFVDLGRIHTEPIFMDTNKNRYPSNEEYKDLRLLNQEMLDWKYLLDNEIEYYTTYSKDEMLSEISKRL